MKISCQTCQSKYNVADEKVQGKVVKIRCRKCGSTIVVNGAAGAATNGSAAHGAPYGSEGASQASSSSANGADDAQWHVNVGDNDQRTMTLADLVQAYQTGVVTQETFIWAEGMGDWKALAEVETVVAALHDAANAGEAQAPQAASYASQAPVAPAEPAPRPAYEAPAQSAYDPGPQQSYAAAAEPVAQEPRRAAVVKRETRGRDLFSGRGTEEVQTAAPSVPPGMLAAPVDDAASKLTGQRNENSVLFSLAVLTKNAEDRAPDDSSSGTSDDSGMIDLKALSAKAESMRPPAVLADANVFAPPLGAPPLALGAPTGALDAPFGSEPQPKSKLPLFIGLGAGVLALVVLAFVVGTKITSGSNPAVPSATASVSAPTPTESASAATTAAPDDSSAAGSASSASSAVATKAPPRTYPGGGGVARPPVGGGGGKGTGGTTTTAGGGGGAPPATPPPAKKSDCGCNGDLMCLMKCSTH